MMYSYIFVTSHVQCMLSF